MRGGVLLAMAAMIGSAVATEFWAFLLARLLLGLGSGAVGPAIRRIVITRDPDAVGANLGRLAAFDVAGFMLGPLVAAVVAEAFGIRAPFVFLAAVFVGVLVIALAPRPHDRSRTDAPHGHALRVLLVRPAIQATLAACVAFYLTVGMFEAIWAVLLRDHGAETWLIGVTLSMFTLPMIFFAPIGGRQAQARGPLRVVSVSLTIATICTFSYGVLPSLWMLLAVSLVHAVADSFTMPSNQVAAALGSPPEHLSAAQGLLGATGLAAAGLTGLATGFLYEEAGRVVVCTGTAALMAVFLGDRDHARAPSARRHAGDASAPTRRRRPRRSAAACPTCPDVALERRVSPEAGSGRDGPATGDRSGRACQEVDGRAPGSVGTDPGSAWSSVLLCGRSVRCEHVTPRPRGRLQVPGRRPTRDVASPTKRAQPTPPPTTSPRRCPRGSGPPPPGGRRPRARAGQRRTG